MTNSYDVDHGLSQCPPGPLEPVEIAQQDDTLARTGNTARDQEMYVAGIRTGEENAKHNAAIRAGVPDGWKLVPIEPTIDMIVDGQDTGSVLGPRVRRIYAAMLNAAPAAPGVSTVEDERAERAAFNAAYDGLCNRPITIHEIAWRMWQTAAGTRPSRHPDDIAVDRFAVAMKAKLAKKRAEGRGGWSDKSQCTAEFLSQLLRGHVEKGDPVDVGNLAMMLHQRGEAIAPAAGDALAPELDLEAAAKKLAECMDYPWSHMPEKGRAQMRLNAQAVIDAAIAAQRKGDA